jgi:hypothetical protein
VAEQWLYHWKTLGPAQQYRLVIERDGQRTEFAIPGSTDQPRMLQNEVDIARLYRLDTVPTVRRS